jgi:hypothetical protein
MIRILKEYNNKDLNFFSSKEYLSAQSNDYGWLVDDNFILPYVICKKLFFRYMIFPSETIYINHNVLLSDEKVFLNKVIEKIAKELKYVDFILRAPSNVVFNTVPDDAIYCKFGSLPVNLLQDKDVLFKNIHQKHRNAINKAQRDGVQINKGIQYKNDALNMIDCTMLRRGFESASESICNELRGVGGNLEFYVSEYGGAIQGGAIIGLDNKKAYYLYGGSIERPHQGALTLMHWQIINDMKAKGLDEYVFVGARINVQKDSPIFGVQRFKERFGSVMKVGYMWKFPIKPFKYKLYILLKYINSIMKFKRYAKDLIEEDKKYNTESA